MIRQLILFSLALLWGFCAVYWFGLKFWQALVLIVIDIVAKSFIRYKPRPLNNDEEDYDTAA